MDQTIEKMADEKANMMGNQFFGTPHEETKECAVMGLIKNQIIVLDEELNEAKLRYADVALEEENWSAKYERKQACQDS